MDDDSVSLIYSSGQERLDYFLSQNKNPASKYSISMNLNHKLYKEKLDNWENKYSPLSMNIRNIIEIY